MRLSLPPSPMAVSRNAMRRAIFRRTVAVILIVLALAGGALAAMVALANDYEEAMANWASENELDLALDDTLRTLYREQAEQRGLAFTGNPRSGEAWDESVLELDVQRARLHAALSRVGEGARGQVLMQAIDARLTFSRRTVELARGGDLAAAEARIASGQGSMLLERVRRIIDELRTHRVDAMARHDQDRRAAWNRMALALAVAALLVLALAAFALVAMRRDLLALDSVARALEERERRFREIAEMSSDLILVHGRDGAIQYASPAVITMLGFTPEELIAKGRLDSEDSARLAAVVEPALERAERPGPVLQRVRAKNGAVHWLETKVSPLIDDDGQVRRYQSTSRDVSDRVRADAALRAQAAELEQRAGELLEMSTRDVLTGLLNRRGLEERAAALFESAAHDGAWVVAYFADLDGLKEINDQLGHDEGDRAIVESAEVLRAVSRHSDVVARLGGDEMVVLGMVREGDSSESFTARVEEEIRRRNAEGARPYRLSMSIGQARLRAGAPEASIDALLSAADADMYRRKKERKRAGHARSVA